MAKDLICGMEVNESTAKFKTVHMGKTYYFCAPECKKTFEDNPMKYTGESSGHATGQGHCCC